MTTKVKAPARAKAPLAGGEAAAGPWATPPWTMEERVQRIEAMGQRISGYVRFMCQAGSMNGTSAEAKERAVRAFYERMVIVERQLAVIQEEFRLG